jgi:tryptophan synthase alpha chain
MGRIEERFRVLRSRDERALIPFITAGDPDLDTTERLILALADAGADAIEVGVPFSDPMAEGPTIQRSSERALRGGASLRRVLEVVRNVRPRVEVPLILMGYANNFFAMGETGFADAARTVGVDGVIVVDLPPEEGVEFYASVRDSGVDPILPPMSRRPSLRSAGSPTCRSASASAFRHPTTCAASAPLPTEWWWGVHWWSGSTVLRLPTKRWRPPRPSSQK